MSPYKNSYQPNKTPVDGAAALKVPPEDYDFNFVFPVSVLSSDRVELRPFVVSMPIPHRVTRSTSGVSR